MKRQSASSTFALIILFAMLILLFGQASSAPNLGGKIIHRSDATDQGFYSQPTNQLIIKYKPSALAGQSVQPASADQMQRVSSVAGETLTYFREMSDGASVLRLPEKQSLAEVKAMAGRLMALPEVEYAEPDAIMFRTTAPNDTYYSYQWHYENPLIGAVGINAEAAWSITTGSANIYVGVIDSGIIADHEDLLGRTAQGYDFISDAWIGNDGDGRDGDPSDPGDWVAANDCYAQSPARDSSWHGTHTAGTIGAASNNGLGVAGVNWNSKVIMARALGRCGGLTSDIADSMLWLAGFSVADAPVNSHPVKVVNMSLGGQAACSATYQNAVNAIVAAGTTIVVSAGNSSDYASNYAPGNCSGVITVAATDRYGDISYYSNFDSTVEISAPGGDVTNSYSNGVLSTGNEGLTVPTADAYIYMQGTSMAAPHVTGVVSLLYSLNPALTPGEVLSILQSTATAFGSSTQCNTYYPACGAGIVNAGSAVANVGPGAFSKSVPTSGTTGVSVTPTLSWGAASGALSYAYCYDTSNNGACDSTWNNVGASQSASLAGLSGATTYYWQVRAINAGGTTEADNSTWWSFTTLNVNQPPGQPANPTPANSAMNVPVSTNLSWSAGVDPDGDQQTYTVYLGTTTNPTTPVTGTNCQNTVLTTGCNPSQDLTANTLYYWKVVADDGHAHTTASPVWSFTTVLIPPGAFAKSTPANGAASIFLSPTLRWDASSGATSYTYCYDTTNNNTCDGVWNSAGSNTSIQISGLSNLTTYYWQVRASNSSGTTEANTATWWSFTTIPVSASGLGDVNCDDAVNVTDGLFILQYDVLLRQAGNTCPLVGSTLNTTRCDVNGDSACNVVDGLFVLQCDVGVNNIFCPASGLQPAAQAPSLEVYQGGAVLKVGAGQVSPDQDVIVPLSLQANDNKLSAMSLEVRYDPERWQVVGCTVGPNAALDAYACNDSLIPGVARLSALATTGQAGEFALAHLTFRAVGASGDVALTVSQASVFDQAGNAVQLTIQDGEPVNYSSSIFMPLVWHK